MSASEENSFVSLSSLCPLRIPRGGSECFDGSCPGHGTQPHARRPRECPRALLPESLRLSHHGSKSLSLGRVGGVHDFVCSFGFSRSTCDIPKQSREDLSGGLAGVFELWLVRSQVWNSRFSDMPDCGERPAEENERRLETASCRDPPPNNYGAQMLERSLPPQQQQQQQQQSGGRKKTGGIMRLPNYKGWIVEIRIPKWADHSKLWINSEDHEAAQYIADAAYCLTGQLPFHFPNVKFEYLPLRLSTGEELTTRVNCLAHVAKIAKGPALRSQRQDFKERAQKLILEMVKDPKVVQFLNIMRASPRPQANPDGTSSPFTDDENGTAMEVDTPSDEAIEALASTVAVNPSRCDSLVPVAEDTHSVKANDGEGENETPLEVDSLGEEAIQTLAPTGNQDAASLFQFDSTMTSFSMGVDWSSAFIPSFEMNLDEPENFLTSADLSLEIWHPRSGEKKEKEDLVPDNYKEFLASLDGYEEVCKSIGPPRAPFVPHSPLLATSPGSGW